MNRTYCKSMLIVVLGCIGSIANAQQIPVQGSPVDVPLIQATKNPYVFVEPGTEKEAVLHADGSKIMVATQTVWRPMCYSTLENVTANDFKNIVLTSRALAQTAEDDQVQGNAQRGTGFDIIFSNLSGFTAEALTSLAEVETFIESQFSDNVTITINISFGNLGGCGVIGSTGPISTSPSWTTTLNGLVNGMDGDDTIQSSLPMGTTFPVRYNGNSSTVTSENRVFVTIANFKATIGAIGGNAASMTFNTSCTFDFDPSNGVSGLDFQSVLVHEVGHAMGFTSGTDFRINDMEMLDVFRFQRTDGIGDFNPDTLAEFGTTARLVDFNTPNDNHNSDLITVEYRMSDGDPSQASHFRDEFPPIGIMDPTLASGQTFWPDFYTTADLDMFDAIGWDFTPVLLDAAPPTPDPMTFGSPPSPAGTTAVTMSATTATDFLNPLVEYFFTGVAGPGVLSSGWQTSTVYVNSLLTPNTLYTYTVKARDSAPNLNETLPSASADAVTLIESPSFVDFGAITSTSIEVIVGGPFTNLAVGNSGVFIQLTPAEGTGGNVWVQTSTVPITGLTPDTTYFIRAKSRNQLGVENALTGTFINSTLSPCLLLGDINGDTIIDGLDIAAYVRVKLGAPAVGDDPGCADFGNPGNLDLDTAAFINLLMN